MADNAMLDLDKMLLEESAAGTDAAIVMPEQLPQGVETVTAAAENVISETPSLIENPVLAFLCDLLGQLPFETLD